MFTTLLCASCLFFFFKQKTAYEMRISDWSSDVCSSDLMKVASDCPSPCVLALAPACRHLTTAPTALRACPISAAQARAWAATVRVPMWSAVPLGPISAEISITPVITPNLQRSEERRVGTEGVSKCRSWWSMYHETKKTNTIHYYI